MSYYSEINHSRYNNKDKTTTTPMKILFGEGHLAEIIARIIKLAAIWTAHPVNNAGNPKGND